MVEDDDSTPRVIPGLPKGSGSRAPWIVLAVLLIAGAALLLAILLVVWFFGGSGS